jgi:hypothetical protein
MQPPYMMHLFALCDNMVGSGAVSSNRLRTQNEVTGRWIYFVKERSLLVVS